MLSLTNIFTQIIPAAALLPQDWLMRPAEENAMAMAGPELLADMPIMLNIHTAFVYWWATPSDRRTVLRVRPGTAEYLRSVSIGFTPRTTPPVWGGEAVVLESTGGHQSPLVGDIWSIAAYMHFSQSRQRPELCLVWLEGGAASFAAFPCGRGIEISESPDIESLADISDILQSEEIITDGGSPEYRASAISALKMVLAASYYAGSPDMPGVEVTAHRGARGEGKGAGKSSLWHYQNLFIAPQYEDAGTGSPHQLDKDGKALAPVIVRPHIRMIKDKAIIIDAHASHRWKKESTATIGTKKKI